MRKMPIIHKGDPMREELLDRRRIRRKQTITMSFKPICRFLIIAEFQPHQQLLAMLIHIEEQLDLVFHLFDLDPVQAAFPADELCAVLQIHLVKQRKVLLAHQQLSGTVQSLQ